MSETTLSVPVGGTDKPARVRLLDALRGIAIFLMILHHLTFNVAWIFFDGSSFARFCSAVYDSFVVSDLLQPFFQCLFFFLSGAVCRYSRSNYRRGTVAFLLGVAMEVVTGVVLPAIDADLFAGCEIRFGILSCLGSCMILWALVGDGFDRLSRLPVIKFLMPFLLMGLWLLFYPITSKTYDVDGLHWLGFASARFYSADWFPILPWIFVFFLGAWAGRFIREGRLPGWFYRIRIPFFDFIGRHTLPVYLLHQPVVFGLCYLLFEVL